jgi:GDP-4-dehydro-6-deoxy-D-mannose reductase
VCEVKILITGASGFIGRSLTSYAQGLGHEVVGTYLSDGELGARDLPKRGVAWQRLDMQDSPAITRMVEETRPEAVFHLAAQAYAQRAWKDPVDTFETNVIGTIRLYEALRLHPPKAGVLLAASGAAYGAPNTLPIREEFALNATNPYGVSKAAQDMLSLQYSLNFGLRIVRARLFGTTGPGKTGDAMNDFAKQVAALEHAGKAGTLRAGNLDTLRDISDIRDVVRAMWLIFEKGDPSEAVNVGSGRSVSIRWIADHLLKIAKVPITIQQDPSLLRPTDEPDNRADISRLKTLGFEARYPLERTISDALDYWRSA